jgi:hypothetical protein
MQQRFAASGLSFLKPIKIRLYWPFVPIKNQGREKRQIPDFSLSRSTLVLAKNVFLYPVWSNP